MTCLFKIKSVVVGLLFLVICFFGTFHITTAQGTANQGSDSSAAQAAPPTNTTPTAATPGTPNLTYQPLVGIPGVSNGVTDFGTYINQLYFLAISLAALLAVIKIIIAGVKYMLTDIVPGKEAAKKDIWGSLLGLLLIISAVLILGTINPNLTNLNVLSGAPMLRPSSSGTVTTPQQRTQQAYTAALSNEASYTDTSVAPTNISAALLTQLQGQNPNKTIQVLSYVEVPTDTARQAEVRRASDSVCEQRGANDGGTFTSSTGQRYFYCASVQ